jgi:hypothetical protein
MSNNIIDLPMRVNKTQSLSPQHKKHVPAVRLNNEQVNTLIDSGTRIADGILSIAKDIVDIARINAESNARVAEIEARSHALVNALRAETDYLMESNKGIRTRGEAAALIIRTVLEHIPEADSVARQRAIDQLYNLIKIVITDKPSVLRLNYD